MSTSLGCGDDWIKAEHVFADLAWPSISFVLVEASVSIDSESEEDDGRCSEGEANFSQPSRRDNTTSFGEDSGGESGGFEVA